jgi:xylulokinase
MVDDLVLVIDVGTGSTRAGVFSLLENRTLDIAARECSVSHPAPGRAEFDPRAWWEGIISAAREAVERADRPPGDYLGVTATSLRQGFVLLDGDGDPVAPGVLNYDRRGARFTDVVDSAVGEERLYQLTGHWSAPELTLPKLLWIRAEEPATWARARSLLFVHDWVLYRFCGEGAPILPWCALDKWQTCVNALGPRI